ncbi:hypothetical protein [Streptomyces phytophilus]|uniref:hypothetical protein n=1 Tax=Streptomyces phytophilus TaxID=722715 RepID=UPI0015EFF199|nr:hypothetical protein [Streptomyces phytophilus]
MNSKCLDAAFAALNRAFLVPNGDQRYYKESLDKTEKDCFWRQALDIQAVQDVHDSAPRTETRDLTARLLDTFLQQNQGGGGLYDRAWNEYNDDRLGAGLAFVRGHRITGDQSCLDQTRYAFNRVYDREGTWQSEFARGMGEFVRENNLWGDYDDFMKRNADAAWSVRRTDLDLSWNRWDAQTRPAPCSPSSARISRSPIVLVVRR